VVAKVDAEKTGLGFLLADLVPSLVSDDAGSTPLGPLGRALEALRTRPMSSEDVDALRERLTTTEKEIASRRLELANAERERDRLLARPRRKNHWPALAGALLPRYGESVPADATARLALAVSNGWIRKESSQETRDALRAIDHETLWRALHLDTDADALLSTMKRDLRQRIAHEKACEERLASFDHGVSGLSLKALDPTRASSDELRRLRAMLTLREALLVECQDAATGRSMLESFVADVESKSRPHAAKDWRCAQLQWLFGVLQAAQHRERRWTLPRLARLVLASSDDFVEAPCPQFVARYMKKDDALHELLKKQFSRAGTNQPRALSGNRRNFPSR
jgi:hypothetical protein